MHNSLREKNDELDFFRTKNFYSLRDIVKKTRRQTSDWEQIFTKHTSYLLKDSYLEYLKNSQNLIIQRQRAQFKKRLEI